MISLDVVALYPSLEAEEAADICASKVVSSGLWFDVIDWQEALLVLYNHSSSDIRSNSETKMQYWTL